MSVIIYGGKDNHAIGYAKGKRDGYSAALAEVERIVDRWTESINRDILEPDKITLHSEHLVSEIRAMKKGGRGDE
jgi:hypothetical protein